jgi:EmrB/QacA subfamily drug resistance transporter
MSPTPLVQDTRTTPSRWAALAVLCAGMLMIILDGTIVSVALPAIESDLGFTPTGLAWTVNAYLVPLGGLLLLAGRLGDLYGRRRMLLAGLTLFVLASLLCGLATNAAMLVVARFVQGVAAAMASAVVLGMVVALFPERVERAKAMGVYAFVGAAGASIGLVLGGVLTATVGWRWIFLVNIPIGIAAVLLSPWAVAADRPQERTARPDALGGALVTAGLVLGVFTIVTTSEAPLRLGAGVLAVALLVAFVVRQRHAAEPLVRLSIFRSRAVSGGNVVQLLTIAGMLGFQFLAALYLQQALGYSPAATGFAVLPISVVIALVSLTLSGRLIGRAGPRPVLLAGEVLLVVGLLLLARDPAGLYVVDFLPSALLLGAGAGLVLPAVTTIIMSDATPEDSGLASGLANTSQQVGGALGTAVLAAVAASRTDAIAAAGATAQDALVGGFHLAFVVSAALVAAGIPLTLTVLRRV